MKGSLDDLTPEIIKSENNLPEGFRFNYGLIKMKIINNHKDQNTVITIYLPDGEAVDGVFIFGPTSDNPEDHWYEFDYDGETGAVITDNTITMHFVDGQRGDEDLIANGIISFDSGLANTLDNENAGNGGGGCFIDTLTKIQ